MDASKQMPLQWKSMRRSQLARQKGETLHFANITLKTNDHEHRVTRPPTSTRRSGVGSSKIGGRLHRQGIIGRPGNANGTALVEVIFPAGFQECSS
jgi:hypothetical protein